MRAAIPVMMSVPTIAWRAPGVATTSSVSGSNALPPVWVMKFQLTTARPLDTTVHRVEMSGATARRKAAVTSPRTTRSTALRRFSTIEEPTPIAIRYSRAVRISQLGRWKPPRSSCTPAMSTATPTRIAGSM